MKDPSRSTSGNHDDPMPDVTRPPSPANSRRSHPMPDSSRPPSLASSRQASWLTGEDSTARKLIHLDEVEENVGIENQESESIYNDFETRMTPRDFSANSGISAPSNTRVNSAANTPPGRPSTAADLRTVAFAGAPRSVSVTTRDPPPTFSTHVPSTNSVDSSSDDPRSTCQQLEIYDATFEESEDTCKKKAVGRPTGNVKSRKEGRSSEVGLEVSSSKTQGRVSAPSASALGKENNGSATDERSGEGKRKRVTKVVSSIVSFKATPDNPDSSPTRKVSKLNAEAMTYPPNEIEYVVSQPILLTLF